MTSIDDGAALADELEPHWPVVPLSALKATLGILERTVRQSTGG